jgi:restriction endonuclease
LAPDTVIARRFRAPHGLHSARMVNDRFPVRPIYGFEMVDAPLRLLFQHWTSSIENLRRIESLRFSASFRRIYFNENTYALSTTVSHNEAAP